MSGEWVNLVALPSGDWGSVSVRRLMDVVVALDVDPRETHVSFFVDDMQVEWVAVFAPPDAIEYGEGITRMTQALEAQLAERQAERLARVVELAVPEAGPEVESAGPTVAEPEQQWEVFRPPTRQCSLCPRVLETTGAREVHETRDHGAGSVACPDCGCVYATQDGCNRHRRSKHPESMADVGDRFCGHCRREFASPTSARTHESRDHSSSGAPLGQVCPECGWVFANTRGMEHHTTMKHPEVEASA